MEGGRVMSRLSCYGISKNTRGRVCSSGEVLFILLKKVEAPLRFGFREILRYSRHSSSAEPDVGCVYHHTIQR